VKRKDRGEETGLGTEKRIVGSWQKKTKIFRSVEGGSEK